MHNSQSLTDVKLVNRADYRFGGIALNSCQKLSPGGGALTAYDYYPWDHPEFERDPHPWYDRARAEVPVMRDDTGNYVVARYADVMEFGQLACMSVEPGWDAAGPWSIASSTIIGRDAPDHTRLRRQTTKWFAPKAVREWVTTTARVTNEILDEMHGDTLDGWLDLSLLPTHRTMCRVLQVDPDDEVGVMDEMAQTMPMLSAIPREGTLEQAATGFDQLSQRMDTFIESHRVSPSDSLIDALLEAEEKGSISTEEMRSTAIMLFSLGHMDVGYLIAAGLRIFSELPEVYAEFRNREECRDAIINEIVRYDLPELSFYRTTVEDVNISNVAIPAGSRIRYMMGAANRDPEFFEDPHKFDFTRPQDHSKNLSFGLGPHTCAGQGYSRAQARTIFETVAARYEKIEPAGEFEMDNTDFSRHFTKLPIRLTN